LSFALFGMLDTDPNPAYLGEAAKTWQFRSCGGIGIPGNQGISHGWADTNVKFDVQNPPLNLALNEVPDHTGAGAFPHLGLQVTSTDDVLAIRTR
jgi:hypothetical protein